MSRVQASLFGDESATPQRAELERLAGRLPPAIRFGTSTWLYLAVVLDLASRRVIGWNRRARPWARS